MILEKELKIEADLQCPECGHDYNTELAVNVAFDCIDVPESSLQDTGTTLHTLQSIVQNLIDHTKARHSQLIDWGVSQSETAINQKMWLLTLNMYSDAGSYLRHVQTLVDKIATYMRLTEELEPRIADVALPESEEEEVTV